MSQKKCGSGHIYDPDIYGDHCPYCDNSTETIYFGNSNTQADPIGVTAKPPVNPAGRRNFLDDEIIIRKEEASKSPRVDSGWFQPDVLGKTVAEFEKEHGYDPVVGWLVCVDGNDRGRDYPLRARTNLIGRGHGMDIQIKGDDTISSDTHAKIDYDVLNNAFYLLPGNNRTTIYSNKSPVYSAHKLEAYDRLRFGRTELLFVSFCSERFVWEKGVQE